MFAHPERLLSAVERYQKEILRVFSVLDGVLANVGSSAASQLLRTTPSSLGTTPLCMPSSRASTASMCGSSTPLCTRKSLYRHSDMWTCADHRKTRWHQKLIERENIKKVLAVQAKLLQASGILKPTREHVRHACTNAIEMNNADCGGARSKCEPLQNICNKCDVRPVLDIALHIRSSAEDLTSAYVPARPAQEYA